MKNYPLVLVIVGLLLAPPLSAQFNGGDDFTQDWPGLWTTTHTFGGGSFVVNNGQLNFMHPGVSTGSEARATYTWINNVGTQLSDWHLQVDFTHNATPIAGSVALWELQVHPTNNFANRFTVALQWTYMQAIMNQFAVPQAYAFIDGLQVGPIESLVGLSNTATLRIDYLAATQTLYASRVVGDTITPFYSLNIADPATDWDMLSGDTFTVSLQAWHAANADPLGPLVEGQITADNFLAVTGTAIPEPGTAALLLGLGVFALALQRRPRHR